MRSVLTGIFFLLVATHSYGQAGGPPAELRIVVCGPERMILAGSSVMLLHLPDSVLLKSGITDNDGLAFFSGLTGGKLICRVSHTNYESIEKMFSIQPGDTFVDTIILVPAVAALHNVTVTARKPWIQVLPDKTVVNVDAGITNAGTTVLEVLEKSPSVTVDKDGNISLKGKPGVLVMIDGKPTQLSGADLQNLLAGLNASQVELIELMDNPPAKYDAAGNAGIINIKTKKSLQGGFNGSATVAYGQGRYPKNNNNLLLNYRRGAFNYFFNYSLNASRAFTSLYALRTYFKPDGSVASLLEQPYITRGNGLTHTLKTGVDYFVNKQTTLGISANGLLLSRKNRGNSTAAWMDAGGAVDSTINTINRSSTNWKHGGINLNARHRFNTSRELSADIDYLSYSMKANQYFENKTAMPVAITDGSKGDLPSTIKILSAKADYSQELTGIKWESGLKSSHINTDNLAQYYFLQANEWKDDAGKSNHFVYTENIHALYSNMTTKAGKWDLQAGLRFEFTSYRARQLGNSLTRDSAFNRKYNSLFPTVFITYQADTANRFTISGGRRIDRPVFQVLNPFTYIINKYTVQRGNPYILPQYTWNLQLTHSYKDILTTSIHYDLVKNYFSQVFLSDSSTGLIVYTDGNIGKMQHAGLSVSVQVSPLERWSFTAETDITYKKIEGFVWKKYTSSIVQFTVSMNNQFRFNRGWAAELTGFYISKNQNDLQEVLDPTGQVSAGLSKQVLRNKGTLKLSCRDLFYTQAMAGLTHFESVNEYFKLKRDTRVCTLSFTYRFGKMTKSPVKRSAGAATDEAERVGNGN